MAAYTNSRTHGRAGRKRLTARCVLMLAATFERTALVAAEDSLGGLDAAAGQAWAVHGQFTYVEQDDDKFDAPYAGPNSLTPNRGRETTDATLFVGTRLWSGAELWVNPEVDQGYGLDNTLGVAGFPSAEGYKVGKNQPYFRLPRLFVRNTFDSDGGREAVEADANWLGGERSIDRWVLTVGKYSVVDIFDVNQYAHDPKGDFLNWTAVDAGAFDYAADAWGYSVGATAERYQGPWTVRAAVFDLSDVPNSTRLEPAFHEFQIVAEIEKRHQLADHAGKLMLTLYDSRGRMALLDQAIVAGQAAGTVPDVALVRQYRSRIGGVVNLEQEIDPDLGLFARYSKAGGNVEAYEFTDVDRSLSAGVSLKGGRWERPHDRMGFAVIDNGISAEREHYLDAGGLGILVGDGKLPHPGAEVIAETYYSIGVVAHAQLSFDYQWVDHPAYNRDRGPVSVYAVRIHAGF